MTRTFKLKSYRVIQFGGFLKVQIAARNLADDLQKILQAKAVLKEETGAELFMYSMISAASQAFPHGITEQMCR